MAQNNIKMRQYVGGKMGNAIFLSLAGHAGLVSEKFGSSSEMKRWELSTKNVAKTDKMKTELCQKTEDIQTEIHCYFLDNIKRREKICSSVDSC